MLEPKLLTGETFADLAAFLQRPDPDGCPVHEVRECVCRSCGGRSFEMFVLAEESGARRTCVGCGADEFIADSDEHWDDAEVSVCACPCGKETFAAAVGYTLRDAEPATAERDVRWLHVGLRCLACGSLGIYEDWKVDYGPSASLLDRA